MRVLKRKIKMRKIKPMLRLIKSFINQDIEGKEKRKQDVTEILQFFGLIKKD